MSGNLLDQVSTTTVLDMFRRQLTLAPDAVSINYFGNLISREALDRLSDTLARALTELGVGSGSRVAIALQNTPVFAVAVLAAWKLHAAVVPVNPMLRSRELELLLADSGATTLLAHPDMNDVIAPALARLDPAPVVVWSSPGDLAGDVQGAWPPLAVGPDPAAGASVLELLRSTPAGRLPDSASPASTDLAALVYTSGTTGPAKAAMLTHANLTCQAVLSADWLGLRADDSVLSIAPLFHVTGLGLHLALGLGTGLPVVMTFRFEPRRVLDLIERYAPTFTAGTVTAFIALSEHARSSPSAAAALGRVKTIFCGGAAVPAAVADRYEHEFGVYIHNGYGLTETASACVGVPRGQRAPVDPNTGFLSVGKPITGCAVKVVNERGDEVAPGDVGEIVVDGPQVGPGYWRRSEETSHAFRAAGLHTGDVGFVDQDGWIYIVDRKKDLIIVSGYKVWPREVEEIIYQHDAVSEVAVVGVPDPYQGESVHAFVVAGPGAEVSSESLEHHCRERLAAYKCPRKFTFLPDLPKSASGKVLRRLLGT